MADYDGAMADPEDIALVKQGGPFAPGTSPAAGAAW